MISVREILTEAMSRANIVPRRQAVPGAMLETGFRLLKALVSRYNSDNLLAFTQDEYTTNFKSKVVHIYDKEENILPTDFYRVDSEAELPEPSSQTMDEVYLIIEEDVITYYKVEIKDEQYVWTKYNDPRPLGITHYELQKIEVYKEMDHIKLPSVQKVNALYINGADSTEYSMIKMNYVPYEDWSKYYANDLVWSWVEHSEGEFLILVKPIYVNRKFRIVFNRGLDFTIDSELRIPENYIELLIAGLTYKLALMFPRLDTAQMERLALDLKAAQDNVKTPKAEMKMVMRDEHNIPGLNADVIASGSFLWSD